MEDAIYINLAAKFLSGDIRPPEREMLMTWVAESDANQAFFDEMIDLWELTGDAEQTFEADVSLAWKKIASRIDGNSAKIIPIEKETNPTKVKTRPLSVKKRWLQIAAAILPLLALGSWWLLSNSAPVEVLVASQDEIENIILPDGSRIALNKNSQLSYFEAFEERKVTLLGEAFFEVVEDSLRPFEIISEGAITSVLGTSFNVRAYPDEEKVEVTVTSGRVAVREKEDQTNLVILEKGEAAAFIKTKKAVEAVTSLGGNAVAWKNKEIDANEIPLRQFLQILNSYFGEDIRVQDPTALDCEVNLRNLKDPELGSTLLLLGEILYLEVDSSGSEIVLVGEGC